MSPQKNLDILDALRWFLEAFSVLGSRTECPRVEFHLPRIYRHRDVSLGLDQSTPTFAKPHQLPVVFSAPLSLAHLCVTREKAWLSSRAAVPLLDAS